MKGYAVYLCGGDDRLIADPCPAGGANHFPWPRGYGASSEYAGQLLSTGWTQHRCSACGLWAVWLPDEPQPQPPPRPNPDDEHGVWDIPDDAEPCLDCNDDLEDDDEEPGPAETAWRHTDTRHPLARYL